MLHRYPYDQYSKRVKGCAHKYTVNKWDSQAVYKRQEEDGLIRHMALIGAQVLIGSRFCAAFAQVAQKREVRACKPAFL